MSEPIKQEIVNLGWAVARLTKQSHCIPKVKLEIFSPDSSDEEGRYIPRSDVTLTEDKVYKLMDFLQIHIGGKEYPGVEK